jgi:hypothetical protein
MKQIYISVYLNNTVVPLTFIFFQNLMRFIFSPNKFTLPMLLATLIRSLVDVAVRPRFFPLSVRFVIKKLSLIQETVFFHELAPAVKLVILKITDIVL